MRSKVALALTLMAGAPACHAQQPASPLTNGQATKAMRTLMGMNQIEAVLGTCKPATKAEFKDQTACTLPFPDSVLMNIHAGAKIDQNAGPIH